MDEAQNKRARHFTRLHKPGKPIILLNVWDAISAKTIAELPNCAALATPSEGIAEALGVADDHLTLEQNIRVVKAIAQVAQEFDKPLTVDVQDGYGDRLEESIAAVIAVGAVGVNLEDCNKESGNMYSLQQGVRRIERSMSVAKAKGVPDFHINARCDSLLHCGSMRDAVDRGRAYLEAGAKTVYVWGADEGRALNLEEMGTLCDAFQGRLNVSMKLVGAPAQHPGVEQLAAVGVARISVGPGLQRKMMDLLSQEAERILGV